MRTATSPEQRFWPKVDKSGECWQWTAGRNSHGYGSFHDGRGNRPAHRIAYEWLVGDVPEGMVLDHICHNRACVRPEHLRPVTIKENGENRLGAQSNSASGYRGVTQLRGKWMAYVYHDGHRVFCGYHATAELAGAAAASKRNELFTHNDADRSGGLISAPAGQVA